MISKFFADQISKFQYIFENGGLIMVVIFGIGFTIWFLLLSLFFQKTYQVNRLTYYLTEPSEAITKKNLINDNQNLALVKALISICPLVGLLGSTTGMVAVFNVIELYGSNTSQFGFSLPRVVIPTLVSLVVSISGLIGLKLIQQRNNLRNRAN